MRYLVKCVLLAALLATQMGNSSGRAAASGHGATGAPGENGTLCINCHAGGPFAPLLELLEVTDAQGNLVATYKPGQTYGVKFTVLANAGNPAGFGFQVTAIDSNRKSVGTWKNLGANVKKSTATKVGNRIYIEHKGGFSKNGVFTAKWVAPAAGTGAVDFHYNSAAVNGNGTKTGDSGGLGSSITLLEQRAGGLPPPSFDPFFIAPLDSADGTWVSYPGLFASSPPSWAIGPPHGAVISAPAAGTGAAVTNLTGTYSPGEHSYFEAPPIDLSLAVSDPEVSFQLQYDTELGFDGARLEVSVDGGQSFYPVGDVDTGTGWYNDVSPLYGPWWSGSSGGWVSASHILDGTAGYPDVRIRFEFVSDDIISFEGIAIDELRIEPGAPPDSGEEPPPPPDPGEEPPAPPDPGEEPPLPDPIEEPLPPPDLGEEPLPPHDPGEEPLSPPDPR